MKELLIKINSEKISKKNLETVFKDILLLEINKFKGSKYFLSYKS